MSVYENLDRYFAKNGDSRLYLATAKAPRAYSEADLSGDVTLMFGKKTAGLPNGCAKSTGDRCISIPMIDEARSLNLSNSVAILCYEALRQQGFPGLLGVGSIGQD
ncbi:MAG: TrmH family RNA methyltransferase [Oscillospiraceae bacterium]